MRKLFPRVLLATCLLTVGAVGVSVVLLQKPIGVQERVKVFIPRGAGITGALALVDTECQLPTKFLVVVATRALSAIAQRPIHHGWYDFSPGLSQWDLIKVLLSGTKIPAIRVTIPEGLTYREIASILSRKAEIDSSDFVSWCESDSVVHRYAPQAPTMEGYLMPDTYDVQWRDEATAVGDKLAMHARKVWKSIENFEQVHHSLTLASIVQAEAADTSEMRRIAGVYSNRLRKGMRLEADPTVQYAMRARRRVLNSHLGENHAYNTYVNIGLPPGPICNVGVAAIKAAIKPEVHNFVFFVARGDGSGQHRFARTAEEHFRNVRIYRSTRR